MRADRRERSWIVTGVQAFELGRFGELTCPECGALIVSGGEDGGPTPHGPIVIFRKPDGWEPASLLDAPPEGVVLEVVDDASIHDPLTFIRHYKCRVDR